MTLEELLEQNQRTITETTGLLKRLHEISLDIAERQQGQLDRQAELQRILSERQAVSERMQDLLAERQAVSEGTQDLLAERQAVTERMQDLLAERQATVDRQLEALAASQAETDRRLQRLSDLLERFLRGQHGDGREGNR
jgi:hypothetical protein